MLHVGLKSMLCFITTMLVDDAIADVTPGAPSWSSGPMVITRYPDARLSSPAGHALLATSALN